MDEIVKEFLIESAENLEQLDHDLVALETNPSDRDKLASIFRTIHTVKGTCGFLAFSKLEKVAHAGESLLSLLRDGVLALNPEITTGLLSMVDAVREMLANIETGGSEGDKEYGELIESLTRLQSSEAAPPSPSPSVAPPSAAPPSELKLVDATGEQPGPAAPPIGELLVQVGHIVRDQLAAALQQQSDGDPRHVGEILVEQGAVEPKQVLEALQVQKDMGGGGAVASSNIRVDVGQLDKLMNLVGELVLARNQILQFSAKQLDSAFLSTAQRLNLVTTELQEGVMKTRMQPIDHVWNKFPRVVRDLALACGKQVRIEMEGKETELDKTLLEAIKDPLTHLIRNSVDHGVESAEKRQAAGKPPEGRLLLRAYHEGGQVNIEVSDDGVGVDLGRVKRKAIERGLIAAQKAEQMTEREALNLLFLPGFSTAQKITNVSGRGVGLDVVKTNIEKIGGTVDIQSAPGKGTTIKIRIPLTLAIIPALIVMTGGDRYAIPQVSLLELVRLEGEQARKGIEMIHGAPVYRLRGRLLPLAYLKRALKVEDLAVKEARHAQSKETASSPADGRDQDPSQSPLNIVVLQADGQQFGLVVDEINDTEEIVVKPLGKQLKGLTTFAGATIMGDGRVALILDVLGVAQQAHVVSEAHEQSHTDDQSEERVDKAGKTQTLLLLRGPHGSRMAVPLNSVARLEEFPLSAVEYAGGQRVVQYRGGIMPVVSVPQVLGDVGTTIFQAAESGESTRDSEKIQVVVHSDHGRNVGLVVDQILDIVDADLDKRRRATRLGTLGSVVVQGHVTELLNVDAVIGAAEPVVVSQTEPVETRA